MSEEMRKMIDKFKSIKEIINEGIVDKIWYHASPNKFYNFDVTNDIGYHFGTKKQAVDRMKQQNIEHYFLYKVKLNIKKPLRTIDKKLGLV